MLGKIPMAQILYPLVTGREIRIAKDNVVDLNGLFCQLQIITLLNMISVPACQFSDPWWQGERADGRPVAGSDH